MLGFIILILISIKTLCFKMVGGPQIDLTDVFDVNFGHYQ